MQFDVEIPNAREGVSVPVGFARPADIASCAVEAERLGYDAVWTNDFITPTPYYRVPESAPPAWLEPIITLAYTAALTRTIKLGTAVIMAPFRELVILAKQAATLDQFSNGRLLLGLGIGQARDEFEALRPRDRKMHRGRQLDEFIEGLGLLLAQGDRAVSYGGEYIAFSGVRLDPKPIQRSLPLYVPGRTPEGLERAARFGIGIMVRAASAAAQIDKLKPLAERAGRDPATIDVVAELEMRLAATHEQAVAQYRASRQGRLRTEIRGMQLDQLVTDNWIGTPDDVGDKIAQLTKEGVQHFSVLNIAADSLQERLEQMAMFAELVMRRLRP